MRFAPIYLVYRFVYNIRLFLEHWYIDSFRALSSLTDKIAYAPIRYVAVFFAQIFYITWVLILLLIIYYGLR